MSSKYDLGGQRDSFLSSGGGWLVSSVTVGATLVKVVNLHYGRRNSKTVKM